MKVTMSQEEVTRMLAVNLEECIRKDMEIEQAILSTSSTFGVDSQTVKKLLMAKILGHAIHQAVRSGLSAEKAVDHALARFGVETDAPKRLALIRSLETEQERISTRLAGNETDNGMGGTLRLTDETGRPLDKKDLMSAKN